MAVRCARLLPAVLLLALAGPGRAAGPLTLDVWPGPAPGGKGDVGEEKVLPLKPGEKQVKRVTNVTHPTLTVYRAPADRDTGTAVLICPGGGYNILAMDLEGEEVAAWLNSIGVSGIVLKYRVPRRKGQPPHELPLKDAQRALGLIRSRAGEWGIDPARLGILGFSAGGHLAAATSTNFDRRQYEPVDAADRVSCRPDFTVLVYPAYLADKGRLNPEIRVNKETPPAFLVHADNDRVSPTNSVTYYLALHQAHVPAALHIFASGGHGFGLRRSEHAASTWPRLCSDWMRSRGLLNKKAVR